MIERVENYARNWNFVFSVTLNSRVMARSSVCIPGPTTVFRPTFPNAYFSRLDKTIMRDVESRNLANGELFRPVTRYTAPTISIRRSGYKAVVLQNGESITYETFGM